MSRVATYTALSISSALFWLASPVSAQSAPVCGDGALTAGEQCDDGNLSNGDGCDAACRHEAPPADTATAEPAPQAPTSAPFSSGARLEGVWRSTRVPVELYPLSDPEERRPRRALALSLGLTLGALALGNLQFADTESDTGRTLQLATGIAAFSALAVVPSAGHLYAGEGRHALRFSLLRLGSMAAFMGGLVLAFGLPEDANGAGAAVAGLGGLALAGAGSVGILSFTIGDIIDAPRAARRHNQAARHQTQQAARTAQP